MVASTHRPPADKTSPSQFEENTLSEVKRVIAVLSGKGGVGKSFVHRVPIATDACPSRPTTVASSHADITVLYPQMFGMSGRHVHALATSCCPKSPSTASRS